MTNGTEPAATESSPLLLPKAARDPPKSKAGPNGAPIDNVETNGHLDSAAKPTSEEEEPDEDDREAQFEGMPEVKKNFKYIVPAIAIGVSSCHLGLVYHRLECHRFSCPPQIRQLLFPATGRLVVIYTR